MKDSKKSLLAIFPQLPMPQFAGDRQKVNNLIKILNKNFHLHIIIISRQRPTIEDNDFLQQYSQSFSVLYLSKFKIITNLLRGIFTSQPLQVSFFYNSPFQRIIDDKLLTVDAVFCNLIRVAKYAENVHLSKYIDIVDSLSINYKRSAENVSSWFWKFVYTIEYKRLHTYEEKVIRTFNTSFLVNHIEYEYWKNKISTQSLVWLPQGIKEELFSYNKYDNTYVNSIMFIGKMDYRPNIDAVVWFLNNVWSFVNTNINFYIVGVNPPPIVNELQKKFSNVHVTGYIKDPYLIMNSCAAVISPMQTGGGIQNKILEAMALGKINIATTRGAESIRYAEINTHFIVTDNPKEMANIIEKVVYNKGDYTLLKQKAKELAFSVYTWSNFEIELIKNI